MFPTKILYCRDNVKLQLYIMIEKICHDSEVML